MLGSDDSTEKAIDRFTETKKENKTKQKPIRRKEERAQIDICGRSPEDCTPMGCQHQAFLSLRSTLIHFNCTPYSFPIPYRDGHAYYCTGLIDAAFWSIGYWFDILRCKDVCCHICLMKMCIILHLSHFSFLFLLLTCSHLWSLVVTCHLTASSIRLAYSVLKLRFLYVLKISLCNMSLSLLPYKDDTESHFNTKPGDASQRLESCTAPQSQIHALVTLLLDPFQRPPITWLEVSLTPQTSKTKKNV